MRLIPLPRQLRAYWLPGTPAFWITPAPANFVHCMSLIARLLSASMHVFSRALRTLAIPPTPAGFVPLWSAYPLPSMFAFAFAVCALDLRRLPVLLHIPRVLDHSTGTRSPPPHAARRPPPPDPTSHACTMPATHALASPLAARTRSPLPCAACRPPPDTTTPCILKCPPPRCSLSVVRAARSPPSTHSIPAARTLVLCSLLRPLLALAPLLGPAVFVFSPPSAPFP
ncbi:hypothetical protein B0H14DRAFT_3444704 [Mycena olivaceomarginata]|nr:hypothetical protein B0H14DRAFT_3444704 [Mycena olivaceomarginata]